MRSREFVPPSPSVRLGRFACARLVFLPLIAAGETKLAEPQRQRIIRVFLAESPFVHRALPRGKAGVRIDGEKITPSEAELNHLVAESGIVAKPGDRVKITAVRFVHEGVIFEINGGPVKRKSWKDRVSIGIDGADPRSTQQQQQTGESVNTDSTGSSVFLSLKNDANLTTDQIKDLLAPVLDFKAANAAEAYQKSLPPKLAEAIKSHHALVGMDKEMVQYALGRPPHRVRETMGGKEIEEWIYGAPPQDVEFVRFQDGKVSSIEDMKVSGEKRVRTEDEVGDLGSSLNASTGTHIRPDAVASPTDERRSAPTLMRPGEKQNNPDSDAADQTHSPMPATGGPGATPQNPASRMPSGPGPGNGPN